MHRTAPMMKLVLEGNDLPGALPNSKLGSGDTRDRAETLLRPFLNPFSFHALPFPKINKTQRDGGHPITKDGEMPGKL